MTRSAAEPAPSSGPLAGIVVADLSRVLAGPYAAMLLGDLGATVIKVEHPDGDETRGFRPPVRDDEATYFLSANRNKQGIVLDFADAEQLATAHAIVDRADIVVENFRPGSLARFGLDHASLAERRPDLIYASITGFGTGAGREIPGYDLSAQALSGLMSLQGETDAAPARAGFALFDVLTGMFAVSGILAALHHRDRTGEGQLVELDLMSVALASMVNQTTAFVAGDVVPTRMGNEHPSLAPYAPFAARDRPLVIAVGNDRQFARLCAALGRPELAADPRFAHNVDRTRSRAELRRELEGVLATADADHWFSVLTAAGVPAAPLNDIAGGVQFAARLGLDPVTTVGPDAQPTVRHPVRYSRTPPSYRLAPPALGEHGAAVRAWIAATPPRKDADV